MIVNGVHLEEINISEHNYTADYFYEMGKKKLTGLHIYQSLFGTKQSTTLDFLDGIQNKSSVKILIIEVELANQEALERLYQFENLTGLYVCSKSIKPLILKTCFSKLRSLTIVGNIKLMSVGDGCLRHLDLISCPVDVIDKPCNSIERLFLYGCKDCSSLKYMSSSNLKKVIITKANLKKLDYLSNLKGLEYLELNYCSKIEDYSEIGACRQLQNLYFEGIKRIDNLSVFTELKKLRSLTLFKCGEVKSLSFLNEMPALEDFVFTGTNVVDGDLTPCLRLKSAWSSSGKKHYNINVKDLPQRNN